MVITNEAALGFSILLLARKDGGTHEAIALLLEGLDNKVH